MDWLYFYKKICIDFYHFNVIDVYVSQESERSVWNPGVYLLCMKLTELDVLTMSSTGRFVY